MSSVVHLFCFFRYLLSLLGLWKHVFIPLMFLKTHWGSRKLVCINKDIFNEMSSLFHERPSADKPLTINYIDLWWPSPMASLGHNTLVYDHGLMRLAFDYQLLWQSKALLKSMNIQSCWKYIVPDRLASEVTMITSSQCISGKVDLLVLLPHEAWYRISMTHY